MQKRTSILPVSIFFITLSLAFFFLSQRSGAYIFFEGVLLHVQKGTYAVFAPFWQNNQQRKNDAASEKVQIVAQAAIQAKEMQALRDQFQITNPPSKSLLPSRIVGLSGYIPGIARPTAITIDKGEADGVHAGLAVVYKDHLVGKATKVTKQRSEVALLTKNDLSFTAKTVDGVNGLIRVESSELLLRNVLLSDNLNVGDIVVTKGEQDVTGHGFLPDIVVGKVTSVDKKPSALFQSAKVQSMVDPLTLQTVFVAMTK